MSIAAKFNISSCSKRYILTRIACCMKSIAISRPNSSPAIRVNLLIMQHAPNIAIIMSKKDVQTQTLKVNQDKRRESHYENKTFAIRRLMKGRHINRLDNMLRTIQPK